jgi:hypothetical protein
MRKGAGIPIYIKVRRVITELASGRYWNFIVLLPVSYDGNCETENGCFSHHIFENDHNQYDLRSNHSVMGHMIVCCHCSLCSFV